MDTTTTIDNAKPEDIAEFDDPFKTGSIEDGTLLRCFRSERLGAEGGYLYGISKGGFGTSRGGMGNAIFIDNESRTIEATITGSEPNSVRWERYFPGLQACTNLDAVKKHIAETVPEETYELLQDVTCKDSVANAGQYPALLHSEYHGNIIVIAYNLECEQPFAIGLRRGRSEAFIRNVNGVFERSPDNVCSQCYRPTDKANSKTFSLVGDNTTTCTDCHTPTE